MKYLLDFYTSYLLFYKNILKDSNPFLYVYLGTSLTYIFFSQLCIDGYLIMYKRSDNSDLNMIISIITAVVIIVLNFIFTFRHKERIEEKNNVHWSIKVFAVVINVIIFVSLLLIQTSGSVPD